VTLRFGNHRRSLWLYEHENALRESGAVHIAGIDEVGRGALAGPLTVCAVVLKPGRYINDLNDSKQLTALAREQISAEVRSNCVDYALIHISAPEIDSLGLSCALRKAARLALRKLSCQCDHVLVDGNLLGIHQKETAIVSGDRLVAAIAAASVVAKVARDSIMIDIHERYPEYDFLGNKGYGTRNHLQAIATHGLTPLHRRSFKPCAIQSKILERFT